VLWVCLNCGTRYAGTLKACPHCGSAECVADYELEEAAVPKITVSGGASHPEDLAAVSALSGLPRSGPDEPVAVSGASVVGSGEEGAQEAEASAAATADPEPDAGPDTSAEAAADPAPATEVVPEPAAEVPAETAPRAAPTLSKPRAAAG
jgi:predicted  nucleic acid-binding Zn-ribbon protein